MLEEGQPIKGHRIKVLGAAGLKTDTIVHSGDWVEVTIRGVAGFWGFDPQEAGLVREIEVKASQQHCEVAIIEQPPEPAPEGQEPLSLAPDAGTDED